MNNQRRILIGVFIFIIGLMLVSGISYAYFTANLTGEEETTTINVTGGSMKIIYNGGVNIILNDIIPDNSPAAVKTFTVTGNNTTGVLMMYQINLIIESNTFTTDTLKYRLISTNTDENGIVAPSITEDLNIDTGSSLIDLGVGEFDSPTNGDKVHTYNLEIYFPNQEYNQNIDQEKELNAYIEIINYFPTTNP